MADRLSDRVYLGALGLLPKALWSRAVGVAAHASLPRPLATASIKAFAKAYDIDLEEAADPVESFRSIGDFFTRRLRPGARSVDRRPGVAVSPADGRILNAGRIEEGRIIQAKGRTFSVADLLDDPAEAPAFMGGHWVTVYLSPRDYHRVHHPVEGKVTHARYVPGQLWPVNRHGVEGVADLFAVNERVVTHVEGPLGRVTTIMVGATSVGHITMAYDDEIQSNRGRPGEARTYGEGVPVARGDELGVFHLGSTAIVLFADPAVALVPRDDGSVVRMGEAIARRGGR